MERTEFDWRKIRTVAGGPADVVPVAVQDVDSGAVLMVAYANQAAVAATLDRGRAVFWSTSKQQLHDKGATSGEVLEMVDVLVNCEANSLLYRVRLRGTGACHVQTSDGPHLSCFYRPYAHLV